MTPTNEEIKAAVDVLYDYAHAYADVSHQHQALGGIIECRETIRAALHDSFQILQERRSKKCDGHGEVEFK